MPKKRKRPPAAPAAAADQPAALCLLECPLCTSVFVAAGDLTLHLLKRHSMVQLASEITRAALQRAGRGGVSARTRVVKVEEEAEVEDEEADEEAVGVPEEAGRHDILGKSDLNGEGGEAPLKKKGRGRRRSTGPFRCPECGKCLSSKVMVMLPRSRVLSARYFVAGEPEKARGHPLGAEAASVPRLRRGFQPEARSGTAIKMFNFVHDFLCLPRWFYR